MSRTAKTPSFPFYGKDAYDDEAFDALTFAAQGLYLRLAWWQWSEGSIPADLERILDKIPRRKITEAKKAWPSVEPFFPIVEDGRRRRNETVEYHRQKVCGIRVKNAEGANLTNAKRWGKRSDSDTPTDPQGVGAPAPTMPPPAALERIARALEPSGMVVGGGFVTAWIAQYGEEFVAAVVEDVGPTLAGKRPAYLHAILKDRHAAGWTPTKARPRAVYTEAPRATANVDEVRQVMWALDHDEGALAPFGCTPRQAREWLAAILDGRDILPNAPTLADYLKETA